MTLHAILRLALLLTSASLSHSLSTNNNMLRSTSTRVLEAAYRSRSAVRLTDSTLKRRLPTRLWGKKESFFATNAPQEAETSLDFQDVAPVFKAVPRASAESAINGAKAFVPKTVIRATLNGVRPKASNVEHVDDRIEADLHETSADSMESAPEPSVGMAREDLNALNNVVPVETKSVQDYSSIEAYFEAEGIRSRPVEGGNWKVEAPLKWTEGFGRRSPEYNQILSYIIHLKPGDEGYFDVAEMQIPGIAIVRTKEAPQVPPAAAPPAAQASTPPCLRPEARPSNDPPGPEPPRLRCCTQFAAVHSWGSSSYPPECPGGTDCRWFPSLTSL